jgi:DNA helicase-2/ATP-dependent DNA helicase PcrA
MTVHGAKGLEFDVVFLTGMEEEVFPFRGIDPRERDELEEERRLAYVAITRARKRLFVTHAGMRQIFGTTRMGRASRFVEDIPGDLSVRVTTRGVSSRPPPAPARHAVEGERHVDSAFFSDASDGDDSLGAVRRGSKVVHARFGEGEVRRVEHAAEPMIVAFFPGWGEKKVLARFLRLSA